ncbi:hypothetical protein AJ88_28435 [Mesorhizobium amorphae CCBAU 01583]|nr:hypothetical protein AJ88_28435 [Mesorhizobium amorphae CCBAU 01583]
MGIAAPKVRRQADRAQQALRFGTEIAIAHAVYAEWLGEERLHGQPRREGAHGILEHHRHAAQVGLSFGRFKADKFLFVETNAAANSRLKADDRARDGGFARSAFADEGKRFALRISKETPHTASMKGSAVPVVRAFSDPMVRKRTRRSWHSATHSCRNYPGSIEQVASRNLVSSDTVFARRLMHAAIEGVRTPRVEDTSLFVSEQTGNLSRDGRQIARPLFDPSRVALKQRPSVGMARTMKDVPHRPLLHHLARIHDGYVVAQFSDDAEMMGDKQDGATDLPLQILEQMYDLDFQRCIKRCGWLVGDEQRRLHQKRHGNADALAHATRELMRIIPDAALRIGNSDSLEHVDGSIALFTTASLFVVLDIDHLALDVPHRIERGHRILEDHGEAIAHQTASRLGSQRKQVASFEYDAAGSNLSVFWK